MWGNILTHIGMHHTLLLVPTSNLSSFQYTISFPFNKDLRL
jgi:hypothetical protein